jgi:hypothetical protein
MTSPVKQVTRYASVTVLARTADAGAAVGVVLLAAAGTGGARLGGLLAAALTAPHLLGTRIGRLVDRSGDARRPLAIGCAGYAAALALGTGALALGWLWVGGAALLAAGACAPLLTGGFSSLTSGLGANPARARGVDTLTYGVAGTAGPAAVAALAALTSPATSLLVLAGASLLSAVAVRWLPAGHAADPRQVASHRGGRAVLMTVRPLRRVTVTTVLAAAIGGMLAVLAVLLAGPVTGRPADGAWLIGAMGLGNLVGSAVVALRPLTGEPVRASLALSAALGGAYLLVAVAPGYPLLLQAFAVVGLLTAPWLTATLTAREVYAPPGRRAEVYAGMAGWKITASSLGTALAGLLAGAPPRGTLAVGAGLVLVGAVAMAFDRPAARSDVRRREQAPWGYAR